jgi:hypothetical protein
MWTFLASGTLYLLGVAAVLIYKPGSMFTPDGNWKEFGIGKREDKYTAYPFWLFCITWAIVSYVIVEIIMMLKETTNEIQENVQENIQANIENAFRQNTPNGKKGRNKKSFNRNMTEMEYEEGDIGQTIELPKGYYVLNEKATRLSGMPKYIYLGKDPVEA